MVGCIRAELEADFAIIKDIANEPSVYRNASDDYSPPIGNWEPIRNDSIHYLLAVDWELQQFIGFCAFLPQNAVCWETHLAFLPIAYGERSKKAFGEMLNWMWANTKAQRIVGAIPDYNRRAIAFALKFGKRFGYNDSAWSKDGILHGLVLIGTSRP